MVLYALTATTTVACRSRTMPGQSCSGNTIDSMVSVSARPVSIVASSRDVRPWQVSFTP